MTNQPTNPTPRERIARAIWGDGITDRDQTIQKSQETIAEHEQIIGAYRQAIAERSWRVTADMAAPIMEFDAEFLTTIADLSQWDVVGGMMGGFHPGEQDRLRAVDRARFMRTYDPVTSQGVNLFTNFGFGQQINIIPRDEDLKDDWAAFWNNPRNRTLFSQRKIHDLSDAVLTDGELIIAFFIDKATGEIRARMIPTEQITGIVTDGKDKDTPLWYKRTYIDAASMESNVIYYPDWLASDDDLDKAKLPENAVKANEQNPAVDVWMLFATHNTVNGRGWPFNVSSADWSAEHKKFREHRAAIAAKTAMYRDKLQVDGGQRAIDFVRQNLQSSLAGGAGYESNPPAVAGSDWIQNQAIDRERLSQKTDAGDAQIDGNALLMMAGLGMQIFPHYLGAGEAFRLATATAMETPIRRAFQRYQMWWESAWQDIVNVVAKSGTIYGSPPSNSKIRAYETTVADISTDMLVQAPLTDLAVLVKALIEATDAQLVEDEDSQRVVQQLIIQALQSLGVSNIDQIIKVAQDGSQESERRRAIPFAD